MKNAWIYAFLIWIISVLVGSYFTSLYISFGESEGFGSIFESCIFIIVMSGINSIPTAIVFCVGMEILSAYKINKNKLFLIICLKAYILCFITLYIFFFNKSDLSENLMDPSFWIIFFCYCLGLSTGIFGLSKWHILSNKKETVQV